MDVEESADPALARVADDLGRADADVFQYIQDVDDTDVQDLDYSQTVQDYTPDYGVDRIILHHAPSTATRCPVPTFTHAEMPES